jgi:hypothetical protein
MRTATKDVTLDTWTVRVDGVDVTNVELDDADMPRVRVMVQAATGQRVSMIKTANDRGTLLELHEIARLQDRIARREDEQEITRLRDRIVRVS